MFLAATLVGWTRQRCFLLGFIQPVASASNRHGLWLVNYVLPQYQF